MSAERLRDRMEDYFGMRLPGCKEELNEREGL